jgi:hypothetical protein
LLLETAAAFQGIAEPLFDPQRSLVAAVQALFERSKY